MKKNNSVFLFVSFYTILTLLAMNIFLWRPSYGNIIIPVYLITVLVSIIFFVVTINYVESRRQKHEKETLAKIVSNINAMVILWDADFEYFFVNDEFINTLGYTSKDLSNKETLRKVLPSDAFCENLQAIINCKDEEFCATAKNGDTINTVWNTSIMSCYTYKKKDKYLLMSIGFDLSESVEMKQSLIKYADELANTENKYSLSMELSEIGLILKELSTTYFYLSEQLQNMLGVNKQNFTYEELKKLVHPGDYVALDTIKNTLYSSFNDSNKIHSVDLRAISYDKTYHWYQFRYKITSNKVFKDASIGGSIIDITKDKAKDCIIEKMAYIDEITEIYNRNKFMQIGQETYECSLNCTIDYWVIVFDIDSFHLINDTCGYLSGNKLLHEFAAVIQSMTKNGGFGARIGGDNFALLLRDTGDYNLPILTIKEIQNGLKQIADVSFSTQTITCSAGYCKMSDGGEDFAHILDHAEFSLSLSDGSRSSIIRYDNKIHDKIIESTAIEKELAQAIDNNELVLYYQPKINLENGTLIGMEALIRWVKPDGTIIPPSQFIPVAENSMLITRISDFVLHKACSQNKEWQDKGYDPITISINLTAVDFYQTDLRDLIEKALTKTGLDAQWLDVELTESLALKDIDHAISQMRELKELGVKLSMDDFGTGYSSLSYIQVLPITVLKLDRSFIMYLEEDEISREIVSAVIRIAKSKKIETIAEGIETKEQAQILKKSGCDHAQGFFFGKPMPAEQFEEFMKLRQKTKAKV